MSNSIDIHFSKQAKKFIESQDKPTRQRIRRSIDGLMVKPPIGDIKSMQGFDDGRYRLRVGKIRIIYRFTDEGYTEILHIMKIDNRGDVYKK